MKKINIIIISFLLVFLLTGCSINKNSAINNSKTVNLNNLNNSDNNSNNINDELFLKILATNKDGKQYLDKYSKVRVVNSIKITPSDFGKRKANTQYKALYEGLPNKDLYYVEFNGGTSLSLLTIIDVEEQKVLKIYGAMIIGLK